MVEEDTSFPEERVGEESENTRSAEEGDSDQEEKEQEGETLGFDQDGSGNSNDEEERAMDLSDEVTRTGEEEEPASGNDTLVVGEEESMVSGNSALKRGEEQMDREAEQVLGGVGALALVADEGIVQYEELQGSDVYEEAKEAAVQGNLREEGVGQSETGKRQSAESNLEQEESNEQRGKVASILPDPAVVKIEISSDSEEGLDIAEESSGKAGHNKGVESGSLRVEPVHGKNKGKRSAVSDEFEELLELRENAVAATKRYLKRLQDEVLILKTTLERSRKDLESKEAEAEESARYMELHATLVKDKNAADCRTVWGGPCWVIK
jgi:hypothetical protein